MENTIASRLFSYKIDSGVNAAKPLAVKIRDDLVRARLLLPSSASPGIFIIIPLKPAVSKDFLSVRPDCQGENENFGRIYVLSANVI